MILDASVWIAADDREEEFFESARELVLSDNRLRALDLTVYEVINALGRKRGDISGAARISRLVLRASDPDVIRLGVELASDAAAIVGETGLSGYDAAYVAAAKQEKTDLVSVDIRHLVRPGHAITPADALERL